MVWSVRLDKYFSSRTVIELFDKTVSLYLIPKKNMVKVSPWLDIDEDAGVTGRVPV